MKDRASLLIVVQSIAFLAGLGMVVAVLLRLQSAHAGVGEWFLISCGTVVALTALMIRLTLLWARRKARGK